MSAAKREWLGEVAAWHVAEVAGLMGAQIDPVAINPYRVMSVAERAARRRAKKRQFWASLGMQLAGDPAVFDRLTPRGT